jgi:PhnB protein
MDNEFVKMSGVVPHLVIRDNRAKEAVDFYAQAFDAVEKSRHMSEDGTKILNALLFINGGPLMLNDDFPDMRGEAAPAPASVTLHLDVPDTDAAWKQALAAGGTVNFPLENQFWGQRYGQIIDPFGHLWGIGGPQT